MSHGQLYIYIPNLYFILPIPYTVEFQLVISEIEQETDGRTVKTYILFVHFTHLV